MKSCSLQNKIDDLVKGDSSDELIDINAEVSRFRNNFLQNVDIEWLNCVFWLLAQRNTLKAKIHSTRLVIESCDENSLAETGSKKMEPTEARKKKLAEAHQKLKMWQRELDELVRRESKFKVASLFAGLRFNLRYVFRTAKIRRESNG